jgi:hypothetical protein
VSSPAQLSSAATASSNASASSWQCHGNGVRGASPWGNISYRHGSALLPPTSLPAADHPALIWLYLRFTLSYRDVEELLAERGLGVSYETAGTVG